MLGEPSSIETISLMTILPLHPLIAFQTCWYRNNHGLGTFRNAQKKKKTLETIIMCTFLKKIWFLLRLSSLPRCCLFYSLSLKHFHPSVLFVLLFFSSWKSHDPAVRSTSQKASRCKTCGKKNQWGWARVQPGDWGHADTQHLMSCALCVLMQEWARACASLLYLCCPHWRLCVTVFVCCETNGECVIWHFISVWAA